MKTENKKTYEKPCFELYAQSQDVILGSTTVLGDDNAGGWLDAWNKGRGLI